MKSPVFTLRMLHTHSTAYGRMSHGSLVFATQRTGCPSVDHISSSVLCWIVCARAVSAGFNQFESIVHSFVFVVRWLEYNCIIHFSSRGYELSFFHFGSCKFSPPSSDLRDYLKSLPIDLFVSAFKSCRIFFLGLSSPLRASIFPWIMLLGNYNFAFHIYSVQPRLLQTLTSS